VNLATKYRPKSFEEFYGNKAVLRSLRKESSTPHALLLTGDSGVGKTTLARLIASFVDCASTEILEIDGATHTGIDSWRSVTSELGFTPLAGKVRVIIVDECQALSKPSWTSLLKSIEEPPDHIYWIFCTTEEQKVPKNIRTRCVHYKLKQGDPDDIYDCLADIAIAEGFRTTPGVLWIVVEYAQGSFRQAISGLSIVSDCSNDQVARDLLSATRDTSDSTISLCRGLAKGDLSWKGALDLIGRMPNPDVEGVRRTVQAYFTKVALGSSEKQAPGVLAVLEAFGTPYEEPRALAPLLLSLGRLLCDD
jgi:DNA polymerase-3 subunit gamma/tau